MPKQHTRTPRHGKRGFKKRHSKKPSKAFAKKVVQVIEKTAEHKFKDAYNVPTTVAVTPATVAILSWPTQGTQSIERIGQKIDIRSIKLKGQVNTTDDSIIVRAIVFAWNTEVAFPGATALLADTTHPLFSPFHYYNRSQKLFIVMKDHTFKLSNVVGPEHTTFEWAFFGKNLPHHKQDLADTTTQPAWNYYMMTMSNDVLTNTKIEYSMRMTFTDA